ncbi:Glycoprotein gp2 [Rhodotorula toruloides ATCC 204091]|uniref:BY PROTMAP: gi/342320771/gb/EGU12710.1/ Glycoprotein gp2 [Rhodotorula glutinis ATCC 204091] n=1 Tax=Rhodotorula toruloides TaxID=5286 RepID=A0A0K3CBQ0_RHOTO|nr:Glycoprotein gp2 [Rhodotorula toruloides ATCC 204091]PRQ77784.1 glyco protein gp2 [Rhodotorula toruloides]
MDRERARASSERAGLRVLAASQPARLKVASVLVASSSSSWSYTTAAAGYGRFQCTLVNGDGTFSADPNQCADAALIPTGTNDPTSPYQGDQPPPTGAQCVQDLNGRYYCGIAGAACASDANCDNGVCSGGVCTGTYNAQCGADDSLCLGYLYCTDPFGDPASGVCGGIGNYCQDYTEGSDTNSDAVNEALWNQNCASGYCSFNQGVCATHVTTIGGSCADDPEFAFFKRNACPASHTACRIEGQRGFECIDTSSNIEQCGACATEGGVDCTGLPGVEAVGCVAGVCEIWSCQDGYTWDSATASCKA